MISVYIGDTRLAVFDTPVRGGARSDGKILIGIHVIDRVAGRLIPGTANHGPSIGRFPAVYIDKVDIRAYTEDKASGQLCQARQDGLLGLNADNTGSLNGYLGCFLVVRQDGPAASRVLDPA